MINSYKENFFVYFHLKSVKGNQIHLAEKNSQPGDKITIIVRLYPKSHLINYFDSIHYIKK